ncbi:anti-sigma factor antagonist [Streptomyces sp. Act143]|uniref:STAS domain-containing protein n=1 Tax=Streptomyces sp. Act143 TaxID=2200760 RepID=UPI000D6809DD|nr:STAS domain-containing protein [Streptomyces sp. Act143]PWI16905.1 anti-sigma factor antagonist [Streptomyces sp. Act143]
MRWADAWPVGHIRVHEVHGLIVIEFHGEIDIAAAPSIGPELDAATAVAGRTVVVDLTPTEFFDCYALRLLHRATRRVRERGGRLLLVCPHPLILKILRVSGLSRQLTMIPGLEDGIASGPGDVSD